MENKTKEEINEQQTCDQHESASQRNGVQTRICVVEKAIEVSHSEFENLKRHPLQDNDLIAENTDLMYCDSDDVYHCLLIYDEEQGDGLLIEAEDSAYARYA